MGFHVPKQAASFFSQLAPRPPSPPQEVRSRAGRNLPAAVLTAIILLTIVGLSLFIRIEVFVGIVGLATVIALWEAAGALQARHITIPFFPLAVGQLLMLMSTWYGGVGYGVLAFLFACFCALLWNSLKKSRTILDGVAGCFMLAWIGLLGCFAVAMASMDNGAWVIVTFILLPVANDTGGWLAGITFGRHPIAPKISPKKSWEGFAGSVLGTLLVSFLTVGLILKLSWVWVVLFGLFIPIFATAGDFAESLLKRDVGVKDMGNLFPGHGGMLDRIDSMLFCAPLSYLFFTASFGLF